MTDPQHTSGANEAKKQPETTLREGLLKATIWRNERERGAFFSTQYARSYKDEQGQWHDTNQMRESDHLPLRHLAGRAHDRVTTLKQEARKAIREHANDPSLNSSPIRSR